MSWSKGTFPVRIILLYIAVGGMWMWLTHVLFRLWPDAKAQWRVLLDWTFIAVLFWTISIRINRRITAAMEAEAQLTQKNQELKRVVEELTAAEEELRQQFDELERTGAALQQSEEAVSRQNAYLSALHETSLALMNRLALHDLLGEIIVQAGVLMGTEHGFVSIVNETAAELELKVGAGLYEPLIGLRTIPGEGLAGQVWQSAQPMLLDDYSAWVGRLDLPAFDQVCAVLDLPLISGSKVIGVIGFAFTEARPEQADLKLLIQFAEMASIAMDNARLFSEAQAELRERQQAQEALRDSEEQFRTLAENSPDVILRLSPAGRVLYVNQTVEKITGIPAPQWLGKTGAELNFPEHLLELWNLSMEQVLHSHAIQRHEFNLPNGRWIEEQVVPEFSADGAVKSVMITGRDITERKLMEQELEYIGLHDSLTRLYNRAYFQEEMNRLNSGRWHPVGVIVMDLDGLKLVNDTMGHDCGDQLLINTAQILKQCFRESDVVARIGGDEFAVLLPNSEKSVVEEACRRVREAIQAYNELVPPYPLSLSMGFAASSQEITHLDVLFKEADNNMYREKLHSSRSARSALVNTLKKALEARDFITEGHGRRMQDIVEAMAGMLNLSEGSVCDLRLLAQFHDIGKVGVPDRILFKPGPLTPEEFEEMKRHSEIGHRIAQSAPDLLPISDYILKHHERWDGAGYPLGIAGENIPIECRILAIADSYDAMTSDRPYRKGMSHTQAAAELQQGSGAQFDPGLVELALQLLPLRCTEE